MNWLTVSALVRLDAIEYTFKINIFSEIKTNLEDVITLIIPQADGEERIEYSYSKVKELQGKVMLIAGRASKGKESVDRFVEVSILNV